MNQANETNILRSIPEIETIRTAWEQLQTFPNSDIDFYLTILHSRKDTTSPYVICLGPRNKPVTIIAGRLEDAYLPIKFAYKTLWRLKIKKLAIVFDGILGNYSPSTIDLIVQSLKKTLKQNEAKIIQLEVIDQDTAIVKAIKTEFSFLLQEHFTEVRNHWWLDLPAKIDNLFTRLSSNHRNQLRRISKKLEKTFTGNAVRLHCFKKPDEMDLLFQDVEQVAKKTYQRGLSVGFSDIEENRSRLALEAEKGWLRMTVLYLNEKPVAYWWGVIYQEVFYSCALGYDPDYQQYSPGNYLLVKVFENLCTEGVKKVDFGSGDARYKQQFGQFSYQEAPLLLFAPTLSGYALNLALSTNNAISLAAKKTLKWLDKVDILKRYWRHALRQN